MHHMYKKMKCKRQLPGSESLSRQRDHGRARPQDVHTGGVSVAEWRIQAHVGQLPAAHMLLLGSHVGEDDAARR